MLAPTAIPTPTRACDSTLTAPACGGTGRGSRARAGWLVYDADGGSCITSALQWFGNVTFWLFWPNRYAALAALDDNHDGELAGGEIAHLAIWRDANMNGVSEPGEVLPLSAHRDRGDRVRFPAGRRGDVCRRVAERRPLSQTVPAGPATT